MGLDKFSDKKVVSVLHFRFLLRRRFCDRLLYLARDVPRHLCYYIRSNLISVFSCNVDAVLVGNGFQS